jgi:aspartyl-tRNA(Asn)/glutamyl-tRNA(Gln) amidotransferase subunit C
MRHDALSGGREHIDVDYVANLARLRLSEAEAAEFAKQLDRILDYFRQLQNLDVTAIEPTAHAADVRNVFRKDEVRPGLERAAVLANAPEHTMDQFMVPKIVE